MSEEPDHDGLDDRCPACHDRRCGGAGPDILDEQLAALRKEVADANAERMVIESIAVDAMKVLHFYGTAHPNAVVRDGGHRARLTLDALLERGRSFARIRALKEPSR